MVRQYSFEASTTQSPPSRRSTTRLSEHVVLNQCTVPVTFRLLASLAIHIATKRPPSDVPPIIAES